MKGIFFVAILLTALMLAACGGSSSAGNANVPVAPVPAEYAGKTNPLGADAATAGAELFKTNCESCHGPHGYGDGPAGAGLNPKPRNLAVLQAQVSDDYLYWRINTGKEGTSMIAWTGVLTDEQIWQVISFLRTLR